MNQWTFRRTACAALSCLMLSSVAQGRHWEVLYAFGDSYTDSGAGYVDGDGPTAVVYLAQSLGIPFTYAGDENSEGKGLNFAVSAAQTGNGTGFQIRRVGSECARKDPLFGRGMQMQVLDFAYRAKSGGLHFDANKTLFFIAGGLNDRALPTATTVANLKDEIRQLYKLGGRYFLLALLPTKIPDFAVVGVRLNPMLAKIPPDLERGLPGAHIQLSRWGEYFDRVMEKPGHYGITNTTDQCAGRAIFGEDPTPCAEPSRHFYFHGSHPSTAVQRIVAKGLEQEIAQAFP
jgi:phospholipase/lecithinase/hemolysin